MSSTIGKEVRLKSRPSGMPAEENFEIASVEIPQLREGEVLVRNIYMSVDPYMRGRMNEGRSYVPPFEIGRALDGGSVGQVVASRAGGFREGDYVLGERGWREFQVSKASGLARIDPALAPLRSWLGVLGMPGMTAWVGLLEIGRPTAGETVFVSAGAGAVGSVVCQIAKIRGCRVVASAGSEEKTSWLRDIAGVDAAINYKKIENLVSGLREACPDGVDLYYDNVGGAHLEAALDCMNNFGRAVLCGMISQYNATARQPGPGNLFLAISKRLRLQGFIVSDHMKRRDDFISEMATWIREGRIRWKETVVRGIENAPAAFIGLFRGENLGKMIVQVGEDPTTL